MLSLFARSSSAWDRNDVEDLGPDPEWDELIAWAGIITASAQAEADGDSDEEPAQPEDWDTVIARAKAVEPHDEWASVILRAKQI